MSRSAAAGGTLNTFVLLALERAAQMLVGLYVASSIAHRFTLDEFATWQIAFSMWVVAGTLASVTGERVVLPRLCAATGSAFDDEWKTALVAKLSAALVASVGLTTWALLHPQPGLLPLILIFSLILVAGEPMGLAVQQAYAAGDFRTPQLARIAALFTRTAVVIALVHWRAPLTSIALAWMAETLVLIAVLCRGWIGERRWRRGRVRRETLVILFSRGAALTVSATTLAALSRIDRLTLADDLPGALLAQNAAAMSLLETAFGFAAILAVVTGARSLYRGDTVPLGDHLRYLGFGVLLGGLGAIGLWLIAEPVVALIFGPSFELTVTMLRHACWLLPLVFAQTMMQIPLLARTGLPFHLLRSCVAFGAGASVAWWVVHGHDKTWVSVGAYVGYAVALAFDIGELYRRRREIYAPRMAVVPASVERLGT